MVNPKELLALPLPDIRGRYTMNAPLGSVGWFRTGGTADVLFKPADIEDLQCFMLHCPKNTPITILGLLSNTIIRDAGIEGVVIRLGREFAGIEQIDGETLRVGAAALDANVATFSAEQGIAGLEFLSGVPGSIGGAIAMNAGAYGRETKDILVEAHFVDTHGECRVLTPAQLSMGYRTSHIPEGWLAVGAILRGSKGNADDIKAHIASIKEKRTATQPIRSQTGGSTFANPKADELATAGLPEGTKSWQLVDKVGGRGLMIGGAQMSELHANFMINTGEATAADLENLGDEIRARVQARFGLDLHWEIKRLGRK